MTFLKGTKLNGLFSLRHIAPDVTGKIFIFNTNSCFVAFYRSNNSPIKYIIVFYKTTIHRDIYIINNKYSIKQKFSAEPFLQYKFTYAMFWAILLRDLLPCKYFPLSILPKNVLFHLYAVRHLPSNCLSHTYDMLSIDMLIIPTKNPVYRGSLSV